MPFSAISHLLTQPTPSSILYDTFTYICLTDTLTTNDEKYIDMLVDLEVEKETEQDGAIRHSPYRKATNAEWRQAIENSRRREVTGLDYLQFIPVKLLMDSLQYKMCPYPGSPL